MLISLPTSPRQTFAFPPLLAAAVLAGLAGGCTVGPDYHSPQIATPAAWEAPRPQGSGGAAQIAWWKRFDDPVMTRLQALAEQQSATLDEAVARIRQARATLAGNRAAGLPSADGSLKYSRAGQTFNLGGQSVTSNTAGVQVGGDASWELDLFGKIRRNTQAAHARIAAREDDWHDVRVSLAAQVADDYVQYRGCEQLIDLYKEQSQSQEETARLTRISGQVGFTARSDVALSAAAAASLRSTLMDQTAQCDLLVKSLVSLTGLGEGALREALAPGRGRLPTPAMLEISSLPADLVRQRPDIASAERELAASSAEIGVAVAKLYPSLTLSGSISIGGGSRQWSFGPALSLPLFDGQARANVRSARAAYDLQFATYRENVRSALLEVEQALVRLDASRRQDEHAQEAATDYRTNFEAINTAQRVGSSSMIDRESARRNALDAQRTLVALRTTQARQWIALYKALGGGWNAASASSFIGVAK